MVRYERSWSDHVAWICWHAQRISAGVGSSGVASKGNRLSGVGKLGETATAAPSLYMQRRFGDPRFETSELEGGLVAVGNDGTTHDHMKPGPS